MAEPVWTCESCGLEGPIRPDGLPSAEVPMEHLVTLHQWARFFEHLSHDAWADAHPEPPPTPTDFVHWVMADALHHRHTERRGHRPDKELAGRRPRNLVVNAA